MPLKITLFLKSVILFFCLSTIGTLKVKAQDALWHISEIQTTQLVSNNDVEAVAYSLNTKALETLLSRVTVRHTAVLEVPSKIHPNGRKFLIKETEVLSPYLAQKFSTIKSYKGVAIDGSGQTLRFTYSTTEGFYGFLLHTARENVQIRPMTPSLYAFSTAEYAPFDCETENDTAYGDYATTQFGLFNRNVDDGSLRRYRLALSVSGDYAQVFLDGTEPNDNARKAKVLQAMVNSVNRLNGIFERDLGVTMQLIDTTDALIFLNPSSDPYSAGRVLRDELVNTLSSNLEESDYDVGHLFHKDGNSVYGNAGCIACVCTNGAKGQAYTVHRSPDLDGMNLIAAHEFGHQFGAYHTQSSRNCRSGRNGSEVEPGSGSTIMSYAGICPPNVQEDPDAYFNYTSIRDIAVWTINNSSCATVIPTGNTAPLVDQGEDYVIPIRTAFVLEGHATDPDNNTLTYCWEQNNSGDPQNANTPVPTRTVGPMFRSFPPVLSAKRYFPNLEAVVANNLSPTWEVLPSVSRALDFVMTVRDNGIDGGQTVSDEVRVDVVEEAGPFVVTSQRDNTLVWTVGENVTVTWDVAGTNASPINTVQVEVLLSTDGGLTFPTSLVTTENDGEATFQLIDVEATANARLLVKAVDNVYFAVNETRFTIEKSEFNITSNQPHIEVCDTTSEIVFDINYRTFLEFQEQVDLSVTDLPEGVEAQISPMRFSGIQTDGTPFTVTLSGIAGFETGAYIFSLVGNSTTGIEKEVELSFTIFDETISPIHLNTPLNNAKDQSTNITFNWQAATTINLYELQIATDPSFAANTIVENVTTLNTSYEVLGLNSGTVYFWRIRGTNPCALINDSETYTFSTFCSSPVNFNAERTLVNSLEVAWTDLLFPDSWTIEYGERGFTLGNGVSQIVNESAFTALNLESGTAYDFYVSGNCGTLEGANVGPFTFKTTSDFCNGDRFYDSGGASGNYSNNENRTTVIAPNQPGESVTVTFNSFDIESCCDALTVYDGASVEAPIIGRFITNPGTLVSTANSGALTFVFTSDFSVVASGWEASVVCESNLNCLTPEDFRAIEVTSNAVNLSWNVPSSESLADVSIEYGLEGFILGTGVEINTAATSQRIENLVSGFTYDFYISTNCDDGRTSRVIGPLNVSTLCTGLASTPENLIINGSFECGDLSGWILDGLEQFSGCTSNFEVLESSENVCTIVDNIAPTQGNFAAFTSFDSNIADTRYRISQNITVPATIGSAEQALLSLDVLVNYSMTFNNPRLEREFSVKFTNSEGDMLFEVETFRFGILNPVDRINKTITHDILGNLVHYAGETIVLQIEAFIPERSTGPAKALVDNVSLVVDNALSLTDITTTDNGFIVYPVLNSGTFTIHNTTGSRSDLVEVYDVSGRLIYRDVQTVGTQKMDVTLKKVNSGVYFVKVRIDGQSYTKRIVID